MPLRLITFYKKIIANCILTWLICDMMKKPQMKRTASRYKVYMAIASFCILGMYACQTTPIRDCEPAQTYQYTAMTDSLAATLVWPEDLDIQVFADGGIVPSPACLAVSALGDVYVGVDKMGSLGKEMGAGAIIKLVDCNGDGVLDAQTEFARVDNPRGILAMGHQVFVLHTRFSAETGKAENMDLVVFEDKDNDGVADGEPVPLITGLSNPTYLAGRGTDHATNGIQLGIDGWIYIAVGDFGFHDATGTDGRKLSMLGGGILRVRPDGTEMEKYTLGLRNIYDVAIDPYMNIFTRDNTNDGGGWNIRFSHQLQTGDYGYPSLFKQYTEEIIPALVDLGGGSGTGAMYLEDHRWPAAYNNTPLMADWGRSYLYRHPVEVDGPTFTQEENPFIQLPQITDVDIDGSGIMYLAAWDGAGYSGSPDVGYVVRAVPKGWEHEQFPDVTALSDKKLVALLKSPDAKARQAAQFELLARDVSGRVVSSVWKLVESKSLGLAQRVAALYTYAQLAGKESVDRLVKASHDSDLQEFALRALADRQAWADAVPVEPFLLGLQSENPRIRAAATIGVGRLGMTEGIPALLKTDVPASFKPPMLGAEGPHATPNAAIVLPHLSVKALLALGAVEESIVALHDNQADIALWAMRYMHDVRVVEALKLEFGKTDDEAYRTKLLHAAARIHYREPAYDASWWWGTRPDTHGPYYRTEEWEGTPIIREFLIEQWLGADQDGKYIFKVLNTQYRLDIDRFGTIDLEVAREEAARVDLEAIRKKKGQVGESSIEDIMLALQKIEGVPEEGAEIYLRQGCGACHSVSAGEVMKGPFMGQIGSIMNREQIIESIINPNASISQGFASVEVRTKNGDTHVGFITEESVDKLVLRNIAGVATEIKTKDIANRQRLDYSMMPTGLANSLSYEELASLVAYLEMQK